jgi:hypothetical protein
VQGDIGNLLGCILTGVQLPLTTLTAYYFCVCDVVMMVQYTYYAAKARRRILKQERYQKRQALLLASSAASEAISQYNAANAHVMLHPSRHLKGYPHSDAFPEGFQQVHSMPSVSPPVVVAPEVALVSILRVSLSRALVGLTLSCGKWRIASALRIIPEAMYLLQAAGHLH